MSRSERRAARLLLTDPRGGALGEVGPLEVSTPWWPDAAAVIAAARPALRLPDTTELTVLRRVADPRDGAAAGPDPTCGGPVTYLAELSAAEAPGRPVPPGVLPVPVPAPTAARIAAALADHPLRQPWARPGEPSSIRRWADDALAAVGRTRTGPPRQQRSWNLSCLVQLPTDKGVVWCKSVPPFLAHEATALRMAARHRPQLVPQVLADRPGTVLLAHAAGQDAWAAPAPVLHRMTAALVDLQLAGQDDVPGLLRSGLPDWRPGPLARQVAVLTRRPDVRATLTAAELSGLDAAVRSLPRLVEELAGCGLPDVLVHGDLHPGNWRWDDTGGPPDDGRLTLLDWADSGVGHPLLDLPAFLDAVPAAARAGVRAHWLSRWQRAVPHARVDRAATLLAPLAAARRAVVYQGFLDRIEPDERVYHRADVPSWLRRTLDLCAGWVDT